MLYTTTDEWESTDNVNVKHTAQMLVFLFSLLDQRSSSERRTAYHLRRQEVGFHVCDFPSGFHCIWFQLSHLKTHLLALFKIYRKALIPRSHWFFFLLFSLVQLVKTYLFIYLCTAWCSTEKTKQKGRFQNGLTRVTLHFGSLFNHFLRPIPRLGGPGVVVQINESKLSHNSKVGLANKILQYFLQIRTFQFPQATVDLIWVTYSWSLFEASSDMKTENFGSAFPSF